MLNTGRYKQFLSLPEAAMVWSGLPLDLLAGATYPEPGVPLIIGHPYVTARAEALIEATTYGTLMECGRYDPDMPLPTPDRRVVYRQALMEWIKTYWPDEMPANRLVASAASTNIEATEVLLNVAEVLERLKISRATLNRRIKDGAFPDSPHNNPKRWPASMVQEHILSGNKQGG
jgi:predicted DNA-binding transcriptional regulator AlpA